MTDSIIFTSCNGLYIERFLKSYVASSHTAGITNNFIIDVVDHTSESIRLVNEVTSIFKNFNFLNTNQSESFKIKWDNINTYYACRRYLILPDILNDFKKVWITDIDLIFLRKLPIVTQSLAYSKNLSIPLKIINNTPATDIKADLIYIDINLLDISIKIKDYILNSNKVWFTDQIALYKYLKSITNFKELPENSYKRLDKNVSKAYAISPGGIQKRKKHFLKELSFYENKYQELIK